MENSYYDLDIPFKTANSSLIARLLDCGYRYIAVSQCVSIDEFTFDVKCTQSSVRKKTKEERQAMRTKIVSQLQPPSRDLLNKYIMESQAYRSTVGSPIVHFKPHIFTRLTLVCADSALAGHFFHEFSEYLNAFDIVSFCPLSAAALSFACDQVPNIDLITFDVTKTSELRITNKQCSSAISKGLHLEFYSSPLLRQSTGTSSARCLLAQYFSNLFSSTRQSLTKSMIISSAATCSWEVRRPLAISAMFSCIGFPSREAVKLCLTKGPYKVVKHGLLRSKSTYGAAALLRIISMPNVIKIETDIKEIDSNDQCVEQTPCKKAKYMNV